jgi:flagellar basal body-associated protein FliL
MNKKIVIMIILTAVLLIIAILCGYLYWINLEKSSGEKILKNTANTAEEITSSATRVVLPSLETNALENKPDINPADKSNPIKNIKTNPF